MGLFLTTAKFQSYKGVYPVGNFHDYREPIEYVVDRYFERKRWISSNSGGLSVSALGGVTPDDSLPTAPCFLVRDDNNRVFKIIYGDFQLLESSSDDAEFDPVIWQEELIRESGRVSSIIITFPNGESVRNNLVRDSNGRLEKVTVSE